VVDVRPESDEAGPPDVFGPVLHPVGPKPAGTYWLRRFLVLAVVIGIVVLVVQLLGRGGPDEAQTQTATSGAPLAQATATPSDPPSSETAAPSTSPTAAAAASPTASAGATPSAAGTPQCAGADLGVTVSTDASSYGEGHDPRVMLTVTNSGAQACETNVGQNAVEVRVLSGDTAVWSSDVCYPGGDPDVRTLEPGAAYTTSVVWRSIASSDGCPDGPRVAAGTYHVQGRAGDALSERVEITLS
jgi:hypothetical protein